MNASRVRCALGSVAAGVIVLMTGADAYEIETHNKISEITVNASTASALLKNDLDVSLGLETFVGGRRLVDWVSEGAEREDDLVRFVNHFHNPLRTWDAAGFRLPLPPLQIGFSSILWGQDPDHSGWSWRDVRSFYFDALTKSQPSQREERLARTFEGLGHLIHLIQDAASPAHTRNDPHGGPSHGAVLAGSTKGFNYETFVREVQLDPAEAAFVSTIMTPRRVPPGWESLAPDPLAPVPVARLTDTDRYNGANPGDTITDPIGLAEYTNANFFSEDRTFPGIDPFTRFPYPALTSADVVTVPVTLPTGEQVNRLYYVKARDGETGHRLATVGFLRDYQVRFQLDPDRFADKPAIDEEVYRDYAAKLVPRAVGYSTALIDYFFRGRLDVGLADDGTARMVGKNASPEPLGGGTLSVYAEKRDGTRTLAGTATVGTVALNAQLPDVQLTVPEGAERFVAVYEGSLGSELATGPFRGAVAGKVVSSVRVEEVFTDGVSWQLRTPDAVLTLPLSPSDYVDVRWAEGENFLIARTPFGVDLPNQVVVFEVLRAPNSVAPLTVTTPEGERVQIAERERVSIPIGLSAGTTVELQQQIHYRQQLGRFERTTTATVTEPCGEPPRLICYGDPTQDISPVTFTNVVDTIAPFTVTIPLVLDAAHNLDLTTDFDFLFAPTPYFWDLVEVRRDRAGRLLGLVKVFVTQPGPTAPRVSLPFYEVDPKADEALTEVRQVGLAPYFPAQVTPIWVLVDLKQAQVVGSTAGPHVVVTSIVTHEGAPWGRLGIDAVNTMVVWGRDVAINVGGENAGTVRSDWFPVPLQPLNPAEPLGGISDLHVQAGQNECCLSELSTDTLAADQLRPEIAAAVSPLLATSITAASTTLDLRYACNSVTLVCSIVRVEQTVKDLAGPGILRTARLAGATERLVLLASRQHNPTSTETLAVWDRPAATARLLVSPVQGFYALDDVTTQGAVATLFSVPGFSVVSGSVLALDPARPSATVPDQDLSTGFALLEPSYLYDVAALKFVETTPVFRVTTLPTALAPVTDNPVGDYHVILGR